MKKYTRALSSKYEECELKARKGWVLRRRAKMRGSTLRQIQIFFSEII